MAKNLKLNIKNTQLKEALQLDKMKLKKKPAASKRPTRTIKEKIPKLKTKEQKPKSGGIQKKEEHELEIIGKTKEIPEEPIKETVEVEVEKEIPKTEEKEVAPPPTKPSIIVKKASEVQEELKPKKKPAGGEKQKFRELKPIQRRGGFDSRARQGLLVGEEEGWRKRRSFKRKTQVTEYVTIRPKSLTLRLPIAVKDLASEMKVKASEVIGKLMMHGETKTINDYLDDETVVQLIGTDFDVEITIDTSEEERLRITDKTVEEEIASTDEKDLKPRPPVVTFMGHVDHGKTSLIDAIRKSNRASLEAGSITQHIGAFLCDTSHGNITILDTPGHEAFSAMRERGAHVTDIAVLVVAGNEGIKDQTIEAINHAKKSNATIVVAINKCDKADFNAENVYRQLMENDLNPEAWGGQVLTINCSAVTKEGIDDLVDALGLQSEVLELKANSNTRARGIVLESQRHKGLGSVATLLVQNGTLKLKDAVVLDTDWAKIKTMHNEQGKLVKEASPSIPVKITGLSAVPTAGSEFIVVNSEKEAKQIAQKRKDMQIKVPRQFKTQEQLLEEKEVKILNVILRTDVQGSLEALSNALNKIKSEKATLNIIFSGIGEISESDVDRAAISGATIIGFHTRVEAHADPIVKEKKIKIYLSDVIYHIVDAVKEFMRQTLDKLKEEVFAGEAKVQQIFKSSQLGLIAGCLVTQGTINKNHLAKLKREGEVIWEGAFDSIHKVKEDVKQVPKGQECGILLKNFKQYLEGDTIESYEIHYREQEL